MSISHSFRGKFHSMKGGEGTKQKKINSSTYVSDSRFTHDGII